MAFTIQNRAVGAFAGWAATPGVETLVDDFNGDGSADLALVNHQPGWTTVPVALSGAAVFTIQNRPAGAFAGWAASPDVEPVEGDFNGDGTADLALINHQAGWNTVPVALSGAAAYTIQNRAAADFAGWAATPGVETLVDDFNGDGTADLALVNHTAGWTTVPVALSGAAGFTVQNRAVGAFAGWAASPDVEVFEGDYNGDGSADLALVNHTAGWNTIPVALSGAAGFTIQNRAAADFAGWAATPGVETLSGDFNGDGTTDLALVNHQAGWTTVPVALSGAAGFTIQNRAVGAFAGWAASPDVEVHADDFNGDGTTDLALVNRQAGWNTVPVALSGAAGFTIQNEPVGDFAGWAATPGVEVLADDYNGDGSADLALVNHQAGWNTVPVALWV